MSSNAWMIPVIIIGTTIVGAGGYFLFSENKLSSNAIQSNFSAATSNIEERVKSMFSNPNDDDTKYLKEMNKPNTSPVGGKKSKRKYNKSLKNKSKKSK